MNNKLSKSYMQPTYTQPEENYDNIYNQYEHLPNDGQRSLIIDNDTRKYNYDLLKIKDQAHPGYKNYNSSIALGQNMVTFENEPILKKMEKQKYKYILVF
jgi:hypothetical protein